MIAAADFLRADIIFLEDGRVIEGEIVTRDDENVVIKTATGVTLNLESWEVTKVVDKSVILEEYAKKKKELKENDAAGQYKLAAWCKKHALKKEYEKELRATLKLDPNHGEAKKELDIIEGKIEAPKKVEPKKKTTTEKKPAKKIFKQKEKKKKENKTYPFGTVTRDKRIPGDLDCKGDCRRLVQGGYMKFNLAGYDKGAKISSATLKVYVKSVKRNPWLWVCLIPMDPTKAPPAEVHAAIQKHAALVSGAQKVRPDGWATIRLNRKAVSAINEALASKDKRWVAVSLTFE
jgi:hypothetical protein